MPNCANTGMPARAMAATASGKSAAPSSLTMSTPASLTKRMAARKAASGPSCSGPKGKSTLTSARFTPRRTALVTTSISSIVTSSGLVWPHRLMPTVSPTLTMSTPARSTICAICQSHATTPTIFLPSRFICWSADTVTGVVALDIESFVGAAGAGEFKPSNGVCWPETALPASARVPKCLVQPQTTTLLPACGGWGPGHRAAGRHR